MADAPLIWAGPILRRVEPRLVTVWVAVDKPCALKLTLFNDCKVVGTEAGVFTGDPGIARAGATTLRVGEKLHVGVVVAELKDPMPALLPGRNYSYNLGFQVKPVPNAMPIDPDTIAPDADLRSLKLLADGTVNGRKHLALGYAAGELPGFALPPAELTDLQLLHGSCRRPGYVDAGDDGKASFDALTFVDDRIQTFRRGSLGKPAMNANHRPHQLFLTGDQIYADDVSTEMVNMLNTLGNELIGTVEALPLRFPPKADEPSKELYLGAPKQTGFPTIAAFVDVKRAAGLDPLAELKKDRRVRAQADPCFDHRFRLLYEGTYKIDPDTPAGDPRPWPADLKHFPAGLREPALMCETKFSTTDLENHLISLGEYCALYLDVWSNAGWPVDPQGRPQFPSLEQLYKPPTDASQLWDLHGLFKGKSIKRNDPELFKALQAIRDERAKGSYARSVNTLTTFFDGLPRVRRALANVPTYMVFDDHDVTDDWNIVRAWRDQVHTTPLGRRIITDALVAYAVFQDWGNDPLKYRAGDYRKLLDEAAKLFPGATGPPAVFEGLAKLFGLNRADPEVPEPGLQPPPPKPDPTIKWHWSIDGPHHRVIALDTRTRRKFRSRHRPAALLSPQALEEQLPDPSTKPLPPGVDVVVVISQTPIAMPSIAASVIVPLMGRKNERKERNSWRNLTGLEPDNEIWPGDDQSFDAVLRRLAAYKRVVVLSGEVHWGSTAQISYWKRGTKRLDLASALRAELDADGTTIGAGLRAAFTAAGLTLTDQACRVARAGNAEWLLIDPTAKKMFLVRAETDGLNVYDENVPARMAQFVSSGLKNVKALIATLARTMGFAFTLIDLTPAERLIWTDSTPVPLAPPAGGRFPPGARDRLGVEPITVPSGNWPAGTVVRRVPDAAWRLDMVRDERPDAQREEFARAGAMPGFDNTKVEQSYAKIAERHAAHLTSGRVRFARGALYFPNLGLVRFEREGTELVACHDLYSHPPGRDEAKLLAAHRVPLQRFGEQRPQLRFDA